MKDRSRYQRKYYQNNREKCLKACKLWVKNNSEKRKKYEKQYRKDNEEKIKEYRERLYKEKREFIDNYKLSKGCSVCGYNKCAVALDFHHPNDDKNFNVAKAVIYKQERLEKEMKKCDVLCANCHRELHRGKLNK